MSRRFFDRKYFVERHPELVESRTLTSATVSNPFLKLRIGLILGAAGLGIGWGPSSLAQAGDLLPENLWRGIDPAQVRIGIEIELFPKRLQYLLPDLEPGTELLATHPNAESAAQALINSQLIIYPWGASASETMKTFVAGQDGDVVELRLNDIPGIQGPLNSMKAITDRIGATDLLFHQILKDDVTEGVEYHLHISFRNKSPVSPERVRARLEKLNRLYMLESMALGPDRNAVLTATLENYNPQITTRGQVRYLEGTHFELRWHHASPDIMIEKSIRFMQMSDLEFTRTVLAREQTILKQHPTILKRIFLLTSLETFLYAFFQTPDSPWKGEIPTEISKLLNHPTSAEMTQALKSEEPMVRRVAARSLEGLTDPATIEPLRIALRDPDSEVRRYGASALWGRTSLGSLKLIQIALQDSETSVRRTAASALQFRREPASLKLFRTVLQDPDSSVRQYAVDGLQGRTDPGSLKLIQISLQDPAALVRQSAALALRGRRDTASLKFIQIALQDIDPPVRQAAALALHGRRDQECLKLIYLALQDRDSEVRQNAGEALRGQSGPEVLRLLRIAASDASPQVQNPARNQLEEMLTLGSCIAAELGHSL